MENISEAAMTHNERSAGATNTATTASAGGEKQPQQPPVCLVLGMAGSGKTTLVDALATFAENFTAFNKQLDHLDLNHKDNERTDQGTVNEEEFCGEGKAGNNDEDERQENTQDQFQDQSCERTNTESIDNTNARKGENGDRVTKTQSGGHGGGDNDTDDNDEEDDEVENQVFIINIDPAVHETPYQPNVDIRDVIKFQGVMREYGLGPNGAIMTSLNLYATRFDQVLDIVERRRDEVSLFLVDTPGQIETFTWSASGMIITDALAMTLPTVALFVVDASRAAAPMTFVSNMLYACSILYKTRLPLVVVFNKTDVADAEQLNRWMRDFDEFDKALNDERFVGNLARSLAMALDEFYTSIPTVAVSAQTGAGMPELLDAIYQAADQYEKEYRPILESRLQKRSLEKSQKMQEDLDRFRTDAADDPSRQVSDYGDNSVTRPGVQSPKKGDLQSRKVDSRAQSSNKDDVDEVDDDERAAYEELKRYLNAIKAQRK